MHIIYIEIQPLRQARVKQPHMKTAILYIENVYVYAHVLIQVEPSESSSEL